MDQTPEPDDSERVRELAKQFKRMVDRLAGSSQAVSPDHVIRMATLAVPHAQHAGLTLIRAGQLAVTLGASDDVPKDVDVLQYRIGEGPCLDAATGPAALLSGDVSTDARWPTFGPRCTAATGIRSMLSLRLPVEGGDHAAINFYSTLARTFTQEDITVASVVVPLAALAVEGGRHQRDQTDLLDALASSRHIATAVGIVMDTKGITSAEALHLLQHISTEFNVKLGAVADKVNFYASLTDPLEPTE